MEKKLKKTEKKINSKAEIRKISRKILEIQEIVRNMPKEDSKNLAFLGLFDNGEGQLSSLTIGTGTGLAHIFYHFIRKNERNTRIVREALSAHDEEDAEDFLDKLFENTNPLKDLFDKIAKDIEGRRATDKTKKAAKDE